MSLRIGMVGLGNIGLPMARNFLKRGAMVRGFDINPASLGAFSAAGGEVAEDAAAVGENVDAVVTVLWSGDAVLQVLVQSGLLARAARGTLFVECSTIEPGTFDQVHAEAARFGHNLVDAPLAGGVHGAEAGTLTFMAGCAPEIFPKVSEVLALVGSKVIHAGPPKSGLIAKICNNLLVGINMGAVAEAFALGERLGMDPHKLYEIISKSTGQSWIMDHHNPVPGVVPTSAANNGYKPGGKTSIMLKDLRIAQKVATECDAALPFGSLATSIFTMHCNNGRADADYSSVIEMLRGKRPL